MAMPPGALGDRLVTDRTKPTLFFPKMAQPLFPFEGVYHLYVETFFIVAFPLRVIGVCLSTDFGVSFDRHMGGFGEILRLPFCGSVKDPVVSSDGREVFLRNPSIGFSWVASFGPLPDHSVNRVVYRREGGF